MTGRNHERIPGRDAPPLIGVEEDGTGYAFVVRGWHGEPIGRLPFRTEEDARQAEEAFRSTMARWSPARDDDRVIDFAADWFDRVADWENAT